MTISDIQQFFAETAPFCYLDESSRASLIKQISVYYCAAQEVVDMSTARLLVVRSGVFTPTGTESATAGKLLPGDCYGYQSLLDKSHMTEDLLCDEDGLIYWLPASAFEEYFTQSPHFAGYFRGLAHRKLHQYQEPQASSRFTLKVSEVVKHGTVVIAPEKSIADAARLMTEKRVSSLIIEKNQQLVGIVTDRDLRSRVLARDLPSSTQVREIMSPSPRSIDAKAYLFEAVLMMSQHNIHHLPVTNKGAIYGMITLTDLMRAQQNHPVYVIGDMHRQTDIQGLRQCAAQLMPLLQELAQQQVPTHEVGHIITTVTDALTQSLIRMAERQLGTPPCRFSWLAFGSQARMDQSINADQDNALLLAEEPEGNIGRYFQQLAEWVCHGLADCGVTLCPGNIMAINPELRLSLDGWMHKFARFIHSPDPQSILGSSIFFDLRCIYGDAPMVARLQQHLLQQARGNQLFLFHLARSTLERTPPLSMLRNFVLEKDSHGDIGVDLKKGGLSLITDMVRIHALANGVDEINTRRRLQKLMELGAIDRQDGQNLRDAFDVIAQLRWEKHQQNLMQKQHSNNLLNPNHLHVLQRNQLKDSLNVIGQAQAHLKQRFCRTL